MCTSLLSKTILQVLVCVIPFNWPGLATQTCFKLKNNQSQLYYHSKKISDAGFCTMSLPKLLCFVDPATKKHEAVVVTQIMKTATDTLVVYRHLTGSSRAGNFKNFHFLTPVEIKKIIGSSTDII